MKNFQTTVRSLLWLVSFLSAYSAMAQVPAKLKVDSIFRHMNTTTSPGCALSVMQAGEIIYEKGYGMANLEYGVTISPRSVFHVASVSKHFTAMAVELLVNEGKVSWDDDIRKYVPEVPDFGKKITLRHLVHHVSGLRDQWSLLSMADWRWEADRITQRDVLDITSRQTALNFEPGSRYLYCNTGFTLLAVVVERVSGKSLRAFCEEHIFEPLGMEQTHFQDDFHRIVANRAYAYSPAPDGLWGWRNSIPDFDVVGATSLFTTVHDLAAWDRNFYTGQVGGPEALNRLLAPFVLSSGDTIPYRHGLVENTYKSLRTVSHRGSDAGYRSYFLRFPDQQFTVSVLCNYPYANPEGLAYQVAEVYLKDQMPPEEEREEMPAVALDTAAIKALAGFYYTSPEATVYDLHWRDRQLWLDNSPLTAMGNHRFRVEDSRNMLIIKPATGQEAGSLQWESDANSTIYQHYDPWEPTATELETFTGQYYSRDLGTEYRLAVEDGKLTIYFRKRDPLTLEPKFRDTFDSPRGLFQFTRDADGKVDGFHLSSDRVWQVRFDR